MKLRPILGSIAGALLTGFTLGTVASSPSADMSDIVPIDLRPVTSSSSPPPVETSGTFVPPVVVPPVVVPPVVVPPVVAPPPPPPPPADTSATAGTRSGAGPAPVRQAPVIPPKPAPRPVPLPTPNDDVVEPPDDVEPDKSDADAEIDD